MEGYLGIDVGSISTKGVILNEELEIIASDYIWTEGNPIDAVKRLVGNLRGRIASDIDVVAVGTTGSARKLIGIILGAQVVKNEITAHAIGTLTRTPDVRTIFEIGGQDSKIICLEDGIVTDYAMNTLCAAGTGSFLMSQAKRLGVPVDELGQLAISSKNPTKIAARCTVFAESDLVHKAQIGHKKEDIIAGICYAVVNNYLNNVCKGKKIYDPVIFQGGVSKNVGVVAAFKKILGREVHVDECGHLMGAVGVAIIAKNSNVKISFNFNINNIDFVTKGIECQKCANNCEIIHVYRGSKILDSWGNRCDRGITEIL